MYLCICIHRRWAAWNVHSRALTLRGVKYLIPLADMVNYAPLPDDHAHNRNHQVGGTRLECLQACDNTPRVPGMTRLECLESRSTTHRCARMLLTSTPRVLGVTRLECLEDVADKHAARSSSSSTTRSHTTRSIRHAIISEQAP